MSPTRRLAAILAADVAGYSRLMGADEERDATVPARDRRATSATQRGEALRGSGSAHRLCHVEHRPQHSLDFAALGVRDGTENLARVLAQEPCRVG